MRKIISFLSLAVIILLAAACKETSPFKYESVPNDPMKARIYTLDNGFNSEQRDTAYPDLYRSQSWWKKRPG